MNKFKNRNMNRGVAFLFLIFMLLFLVFTIRFFDIQWTGTAVGENLKDLANEKQTTQKTIPTTRGTLFDKTGAVLAEDSSGFKLIAKLKGEDIKAVKRNYILDEEKSRAAKELARILNGDEDYIYQRLTSDKMEVEFGATGRNLTYSQKVAVEELKIPGITVTTNEKRYYPNGVFASHVLGYVNNDGEGVMGIEKMYEKTLFNQDGKVEFKKDKSGLILPKVKTKELVEPVNGDDMYLTLDHKIQSFIEDALTQVEEQYEPERIIAIVSNPKTGEIVGMGTRPSFDPNVKEIKDYSNHAISNAFEPGSTMKIFTLAAAINEGKYNGDDYFQSGSYRSVTSPKAKPIRDHNKVGWGSISFNEGVQRSSNVGFAILAEQRLGFDKLYEYLHAFKFHQPTGIDLPGESIGTILYNYPIEKITTAFGQGTSITPIQQVQAASAIANDGVMMKPYVIDRVLDSTSGETLKETKPEKVGQPITAETAKKVRDILETVVTSKNGTGTGFALEEYSVAGKTGTAQIPKPGGGYMYGYGKNIFSFLGMAPKENPELVMYVAVDRPKLDGTVAGSKPVSDIFKSVMQNSLQYLKVKPTKEKKEQPQDVDKDSVEIDHLEGMSVEKAREKLEKDNIQLVALGDGKIVEQYPKAGSKVMAHSKVLVKTSDSPRMPDVSDWTRQEISMLNMFVKVDIHFIGSGYSYSQSIKKGVPIKKGDRLVIKLKFPGEEGEPEPEGKPEADKPLD